MKTTRVELQKLLTTDIPDIHNKSVYIYGAGNTAALYQEGLKRLNDLDIKGYVETDPLSKWDGTRVAFGKYRIYSPDELRGGNAVVLICTIVKSTVDQISAICDKYGLENYPIDDVILKNHRDEVMQVYDLLEDDFSREVYAEIIKCHLEGRYPDPKFVSDKQYFSIADAMLKINGPFVDCGAFVGDTSEEYIWVTYGNVNKIIAIEPDKNNIEAMRYRFERLKKEWHIKDEDITIVHAGIGEKSTSRYVDSYSANNGVGPKIIDNNQTGAEKVDIISIDDLFENERAGFIKADIESYEYKMLKGAEKTIKRDKPVLAICLYHNVVDLFDIPLLVKKYCPEYKIALRHHTPILTETVLYAWV